jgi:glyoxylase-like metal-dependent hydrolase (beta-lactamase superfamily II)
MKVIPLSEGSFTIDRTKEFIPFNKATDNLQERALGSLLVEIQPFLIETAHDLILIDAGLGFSDSNDVLQIHQNMLECGIDPLNVTIVLLSHLHKDHSGGLFKFDKLLNRYFLSFPNATHYVNRNELEFALSSDGKSYNTEIVRQVQKIENLVLLEDQGVLDGFIHYEVTAAHSPYHMVFKIHTEEGTLFFGGDDAPQLQQMKSRFVAKYDYDGRKSMLLRSDWWQKGQIEHWTFLFYHDIKTPTISF